ncbi:O-antigen ligase family protein [Pseudoxanthomonas sp. LjRoot143]|uniref:O-antigen ligase family protein n=1 Tax=Pseudoxanthomonas sp. LjRoot143 TaxID=3342266 RepID=UPI003ECC3399
MGFFLYILYVAMTFLRPVEMFAPDLASLRPMLVLWFLALGFALFDAFRAGRVATRPVNFVLLACLMVVIGLSQIAAGWAGGAALAVYHFSTAAMLFVLTVLNLTTTQRVQIACTTLVVCMTIVCLTSISAFHTGFMMDQLVLRQGTGNDPADLLSVQELPIPAEDTTGVFLWRVRHLGFLADPNDLAQAIVMVLPMLWGAYRKRSFMRNLVVVLAPTAVMLYTILLTHSRGALVGIAALFFFGIRRMLGTFRTVMLLGVMGVGATALSFGGDRGFSTQEQSANERVEAWYEALQMMRSNPVFGVGYGNFTNHHHLTAHNSFALCFAELGLPGYFLWLAMLVLAYEGLRQVADLAPAGSRDRKLAAILLSSFIGFLACAWFLSRTYTPNLFLLLAICASAAYCARKAHPLTEAGTPWPPLPSWVMRTTILLFASVTAIYGIIVLERMVQ